MLVMADLKRWFTQNGAPWREADRPPAAHGVRMVAAIATPRTPSGMIKAEWPNGRPEPRPPANDWDAEETHFHDLPPASPHPGQC